MTLPINQIICGDAIEAVKTFPHSSFDCLIVDPPFSSGGRDAEKTVRGAMIRGVDDKEWFSHDNMTTLGFMWFMRLLLVSTKPTLKPQASCYVFTDWRQYPAIAGVIESSGYHLNTLIVWDKKHFGLGSYYRNQHELISFFSNGKTGEPKRRDVGNVLTIPRVPIQKRMHPTQKPIKLLKKLISTSTEKGDVVFDPMCGSGSTLVAAQQLERKWIGVDIEPKYAKMSQEAVSKNTLFIPQSRLLEEPEK